MTPEGKSKVDKDRVIGIPKSFLYYLVVSFVSALVMTLVAVVYANYVDNRSNQRWCGIVSTMDEVYREEPPTLDTGKRLAEEIKKLKNDFRC